VYAARRGTVAKRPEISTAFHFRELAAGFALINGETIAEITALRILTNSEQARLEEDAVPTANWNGDLTCGAPMGHVSKGLFPG